MRARGINVVDYGHLPPCFYLHFMTFGIASRTYVGVVQVPLSVTIERWLEAPEGVSMYKRDKYP